MDNQMYSDFGEAKWEKMSVRELIKCGYKPPINIFNWMNEAHRDQNQDKTPVHLNTI